jgi:hypothetical protein
VAAAVEWLKAKARELAQSDVLVVVSHGDMIWQMLSGTSPHLVLFAFASPLRF